MKGPSVKTVRCAIYTRVSTEHGLDQEFNSLDAQYEAASAYIKSQAHAGWTLPRSRYDDGGYSGGSTDRPDLQRLLEDKDRTISLLKLLDYTDLKTRKDYEDAVFKLTDYVLADKDIEAINEKLAALVETHEANA
jgi:hypothetical protein